jgi:hypothetical protein
MSHAMRLLVVVNPGLASEDVCDALVERAARGPVDVTLVAPECVGGASRRVLRSALERRLERERRVARVERLERVVQQLQAAGVAVAGVMDGDLDDGPRCSWEPRRFDEVVVSCRPWLSVRPVSGLGSPEAPSA